MPTDAASLHRLRAIEGRGGHLCSLTHSNLARLGQGPRHCGGFCAIAGRSEGVATRTFRRIDCSG